MLRAGSNTRAYLVFGVPVIVAFLFMTMIRNETWRSNRTLWQDVLSKSPDSARAHMNLGKDYHDAGNTAAAVREYQAAMKIAVSRHDAAGLDIFVSAQSNIGQIMVQAGDLETAEMVFRACLSLMPGFGPAAINLSYLLISQRRDTEAITVIDETLIAGKFGPGFTGLGKLYQNKGAAMTSLGDCTNANLNFQKALRHDADLEPLVCQ